MTAWRSTANRVTTVVRIGTVQTVWKWPLIRAILAYIMEFGDSVVMAGTLKGRNKRAGEAAKKVGKATYQKEVVDYWPACTDCGITLRNRGLKSNRSCGCPGRVWICNSKGWVVK